MEASVLSDVEDSRTIDSVVEAMYECMSFLPGDFPDWARFRKLFVPGAVFSGVLNQDGKVEVADVERFISSAKESLKASGLIPQGTFLNVYY